VEENYLQETYSRFYRYSEVDQDFSYRKTEDGKPDVVYSLYQDAGKGKCVDEMIYDDNDILVATLPQEKDGIVIPPDISASVSVCNCYNPRKLTRFFFSWKAIKRQYI
jgi:hypothetical protein